MLFDEEMSVVEASAVLSVNEQTIRSTKHKALQRPKRIQLVQNQADDDQQGQCSKEKRPRA